MTASEKLKALEEGITAGEWTANDPARFVPSLTVGGRHKFTGRTNSEADARFCAATANALPEIIAVVEAAEAVRDYEPFEVSKDDFAYDRLVESYRAAVREDLAALDAKLTTEEKR